MMGFDVIVWYDQTRGAVLSSDGVVVMTVLSDVKTEG